MAAETTVALGSLVVAALGVLSPLFNSRVERRAAHRAWLRDQRLRVYPEVLDALEGWTAAGWRGGVPDPVAFQVQEVDPVLLQRVALIASQPVQAALDAITDTSPGPDQEAAHRRACTQVEMTMRQDIQDAKGRSLQG